MRYTQVDAMGPLFVTAKLVINHYGFSIQPSIDWEEAWLAMRKGEICTTEIKSLNTPLI